MPNYANYLKTMKNFLKKRKNQLLRKPSVKKRRIIGAGVLAGSLIFGSFKINSVKNKNSEPNSVATERVISNQELKRLETLHHSGKMIQTGTGTILAVQQKADNTAEFNEVELTKGVDAFPVSPSYPDHSRPGKPARAPNAPHVNPYRTPHKLVDHGLGAAANPAGSGSGGGSDQYKILAQLHKNNSHKNQIPLITILVQRVKKEKNNQFKLIWIRNIRNSKNQCIRMFSRKI